MLLFVAISDSSCCKLARRRNQFDYVATKILGRNAAKRMGGLAHKKLAERLDPLEARIECRLNTHDKTIAGILDAVRTLMAAPEPAKKRRIGFVQKDWTHGGRLIKNRP